MAARKVLGHALDRLGEAIVAGRHAPGEVLPPEPALGQALGVSRTVVREAVKSLAAKGLLVTGPRLGTRVLPEEHWNWFDPQVVAWITRSGLTRSLLRELQELRRTVEPAAARLAARRATAADIADIETALAGMADAVLRGGDYAGHDLRFHIGLLRASHNRMLMQTGCALGALLRTGFQIASARPDSAARSLPLHRAVLDAVIGRDAHAAEHASGVLIDSAGDDIDRVLASRRRLPCLGGPAQRLRPPRR